MTHSQEERQFHCGRCIGGLVTVHGPEKDFQAICPFPPIPQTTSEVDAMETLHHLHTHEGLSLKGIEAVYKLLSQAEQRGARELGEAIQGYLVINQVRYPDVSRQDLIELIASLTPPKTDK